ncbi:MAG: hypothetical protein KUG53_00955 [Pseudomonadales bacterium]|nr:hypothetical protein [Pseudomonadales bacterium]
MQTEALKENKERVRCRICMSEIEDGALKCIHCGGFQDWRGGINLSQSVLALIIALVSILSVTAPPVLAWYKGTSSNIDVKWVNVQDTYFGFVAVNSGNAPGILPRGTLFLTDKEGVTTEYNLEPSLQSVVIPKEEAISTTLRIRVSDFHRFIQWTSSREFEGAKMVLYVIEHNGDQIAHKFELEADDLSMFISELRTAANPSTRNTISVSKDHAVENEAEGDEALYASSTTGLRFRVPEGVDLKPFTIEIPAFVGTIGLNGGDIVIANQKVSKDKKTGTIIWPQLDTNAAKKLSSAMGNLHHAKTPPKYEIYEINNTKILKISLINRDSVHKIITAVPNIKKGFSYVFALSTDSKNLNENIIVYDKLLQSVDLL